MVVDNGGTEISRHLNNALEATDRTSNSFIKDINDTRDLFGSLQGLIGTVEDTIGYTETGDTVTSILSVTENALSSYIELLASDYLGTFNLFNYNLQITSTQTMTLMSLYLKQRVTVKESSEFILQYMAQMGVSLQTALDRNNIDLVSLIDSYKETVVALFRYTDNVESRHIPVAGAEDLPLTMYSSAEFKSRCYDAIETALRAFDRIEAALNETTSDEFTYCDVMALTSLEEGCFGDYITVASKVTDKLRQSSVNRYQKQIADFVNQLTLLNIRRILAPITQIEMDLQYVIKHYVRNDVNKLEVATSLQSLADRMLNEFESVINKAESDILEPMENLIKEIQASLGRDYELYFDSITELKPFYEDSILYRLTSNMRIWYRPIIHVAGALVTVTRSQSLGDVFQNVTPEETLPYDSSIRITEYIGAAFEEPLKIIRSGKEDLEDLRRKMVQTVNTILESTGRYIHNTQINENFVK